jgi:FkbM family methyltransferase
MNVSEFIRRTANRLGFDVCRIGPARLGRNLSADLVALAPKNAVIFDVGANTGRAARHFSEIFPGNEIWSFEPGTEAFDKLSVSPELKHVKKFKIALSDQNGRGTLNIFGGSELNSLLPRESSADRYLDPASIASTGSESVSTVRLDTFCDQHRVPEIGLLKLDTQGFELHVLRGAERMLGAGKVKLIQLEINFSPLYKGQPQLSQICDFLIQCGFGLIGLYDSRRDAQGCIQWCDAVFKLNRPES